MMDRISRFFRLRRSLSKAADEVARDFMGDYTTLDYDWVTARDVDEQLSLAQVEADDGTLLWTGYGTGTPAIGQKYQLWRTGAGAHWLVVGGTPWCRKWTYTVAEPTVATIRADYIDQTYTVLAQDGPWIPLKFPHASPDHDPLPGTGYGAYHGGSDNDPVNGKLYELAFQILGADLPDGEMHVQIQTGSQIADGPSWFIVAGMQDVVLTKVGPEGARRVFAEGPTAPFIRALVTAFSGFGGRAELSISLSDDFNEQTATFDEGMLYPPVADRLEGKAYPIYGDGRDGAGVYSSNSGDVDLTQVSICGRSSADAPFAKFENWGSVPGAQFASAGLPGLAIGDEIVVYIAQAKKDAPGGQENHVGRWETHRVSDTGGGFTMWTDYLNARPASSEGLVMYLQRVPNYTTLSATGTGAGSLTAPAYDKAGGGSGILFIRALNQASGRINMVAKGYGGGGYSGACGEEKYFANRGDGIKEPEDDDDGTAKYGAGGGGYTECCNVLCETGVHPYAPPPTGHANTPPYDHCALEATSGGGGGNGAIGGDGGGTTHRQGAFGGNHDTGLPGGGGGIVLTTSPAQTSNGYFGKSYFGGGGGGPGNPSGGVGGRGGGLAFVASPIYPAGGVYTLPAVDVNGIDGSGQAGGGAGGSIVVWCEATGTVNKFAPHLHAEVRGLVDQSTGRSGAGSGGRSAYSSPCTGFFAAQGAAGYGGMGAVFFHHFDAATDLNHLHGVADVDYGPRKTCAGCWTSPYFGSGSASGQAPNIFLSNLMMLPERVRINWQPGPGGQPLSVMIRGGNSPAGPSFSYEISSFPTGVDATVDLTPYIVEPMLYWSLMVCLSGGFDYPSPRVFDVEICGSVF